MKTGTSTSTCRGLSLVEIIVSVSILAILATLALTSYSSHLTGSKSSIAGTLLETVNTAVHRFNECNYELNIPAETDDGSVEISIVRTLQYRNPLNPKVGSPFLNKKWSPEISSSSSDYRLQWRGTLFTLLAPGTTGTGLKVDFTAGDMGTPYTHPQDFIMAGS